MIKLRLMKVRVMTTMNIHAQMSVTHILITFNIVLLVTISYSKMNYLHYVIYPKKLK